jgi:4-hydroxyphenylpyruvate dioxygenase
MTVISRWRYSTTSSEADPARAIAADGYRSLIYLGDQVRRSPNASGLTVLDRSGDAGEGNRSRRRLRGVLHRRGRTRPTWLRLLRTLGFPQDRGPPNEESQRSSSQGDIRILVNVDQAGFANAPTRCMAPSPMRWPLSSTMPQRRMKGPCAGMRNPSFSLLRRAKLELPAIRGVGGGVVYLIDDKSASRPLLGDRFQAGRAEELKPASAGLSARSTISPRRSPMMKC